MAYVGAAPSSRADRLAPNARAPARRKELVKLSGPAISLTALVAPWQAERKTSGLFGRRSPTKSSAVGSPLAGRDGSAANRRRLLGYSPPPGTECALTWRT